MIEAVDDMTTIPTNLSTIAYFSMEIGLDSSMPTYSGGLGVLAGDVLQAAADLKVHMAGVTLLHRKGYFRQRLDRSGNQHEVPAEWEAQNHLKALPHRASIILEGRTVQLGVWCYEIRGISGHSVPVYFLDTNLPENSEHDRGLTDYLYGGDHHHRLLQEILLGMGGVAILRAMGYQGIQTYHMNEGHCAFATLALLRERVNGSGIAGLTRADVEAVRRSCVFTTHTPVPAGHDEFPIDMVRHALGEENCALLAKTDASPNGTLNMSRLALAMSGYVNGVSKRHSEVSRGMFPGESIAAITNGIHAVTWASQSFSALFDRHMPGWQHDNNYLRNANEIPLEEIRKAHAESKAQLINRVEKMSGIRLGADVFTIGFARRAVAYKRANLLFSDLGRLRQIVDKVGPIQVIFAGKAHPRDEWGKSIIRKVFEAAEALKGTVSVVYLEDYNMALGKLLTSGVDLWLNNPQRPMEASGTSGMKAALNGVPTLSVLDGWWVEGHVENITGWSIDGNGDAEEAASMYDKLQDTILPTFYHDPEGYAQIRRSAIVLNGSYFNSHRMLLQYMGNAYNNAAAPALV